jgi:hypothetical protein
MWTGPGIICLENGMTYPDAGITMFSRPGMNDTSADYRITHSNAGHSEGYISR